MALTAAKDFQIKESYSRLIERALFSYLWEGIYKPMFQIMDLKPSKASNSINVIREAIRNGSIIYSDGVFSAKKKFTNAQALQLEKWGARWDSFNKVYRLNFYEIPENIREIISQVNLIHQAQLNDVLTFLNEVENNMPYIIDSMIFDEEVKTILDDAGNEIKKNTKKIAVIEPELNEMQKEEIARNYTKNIQGYVIKDFAQERIPEMRKKIQELVFKGYRYEEAEKMLQKEFGIMARKAKFLAQNETNIMLSEYKKVTYKEMGSKSFVWHTITDGKERELHKKLNGTTWTYENPPVIDERTGQRGLPGQTYNCRCLMSPLFEVELFDRTYIDENGKEKKPLSFKASEKKIDDYLKSQKKGVSA